MPIYSNPDFRRLPSALADIFNAACASFFALPAWYDLMARYGVTADSEIRIHSDERPGSAAALILQTVEGRAGRCLLSLANAYSVEHGILHPSGSDLEIGLAKIIADILDETPRWDGIALSELNSRDPAYPVAATALRRAGFLVERVFHSGNWYEGTAGLHFADYLAARPAELRNTWRRKRRRAVAAGLKIGFFAELAAIDQAIADYEAIYARSWKPPEAFP